MLYNTLLCEDTSPLMQIIMIIFENRRSSFYAPPSSFPPSPKTGIFDQKSCVFRYWSLIPKTLVFFFFFRYLRSWILWKTSLDYLVRRSCSPHEERWREIATTDASSRGKELKKECDCQDTLLPPHPSSLLAEQGGMSCHRNLLIVDLGDGERYLCIQILCRSLSYLF